MTANPLNYAGPILGRITVGDLHEYAATLNGQRWVVDSGLPYFVARRVEDNGATKHFLDRKIAHGATP